MDNKLIASDLPVKPELSLRSEFAAVFDLPADFELYVEHKNNRCDIVIKYGIRFGMALSYGLSDTSEPRASEITKMTISDRKLKRMIKAINKQIFNCPKRSIYNPATKIRYFFKKREYCIVNGIKYYGNLSRFESPGHKALYDREISRMREAVWRVIWILPIPVYTEILDQLPMQSIRP